MLTSRREILGVFGGLTAVIIPGCSAISSVGGSADDPVPLGQIDVRLVDVRSPTTGVTSATIPFLVGFSNPTSTTIPSLGAELDIHLHDTRIGSEDVSIARLESGEETVEELAITTEYGDLSDAIVDSIKSGSFPVRIEGELFSDGNNEDFTVTSDQ